MNVDPSRSPLPVDWVHDPDLEVAGLLRHRLRDVLPAWGVPEDAVEDALLVVTELVANVVDHAKTPFRLVVRLTGPVLHISVTDGSAQLPVLRPFDPQARRGRGLQVVAAIARKWGWDEHEGGKVVRVELDV